MLCSNPFFSSGHPSYGFPEKLCFQNKEVPEPWYYVGNGYGLGSYGNLFWVDIDIIPWNGYNGINNWTISIQ